MKTETAAATGSTMAAEGFTLIERSHECFVLVRDDAPAWIIEYEPAQGLRPTLWRVYHACEKVKKGAAPWTANNVGIDGDWKNGMRGFTKFDDAVAAARNWTPEAPR